MIVGVLTVELMIPDARTLKDKRRVVQSLKHRIRNTFNVSVADVAFAEAARRCRLGLALVSNETRPVHSQLDKIVDFVRASAGVTLLSYEREML